MAVQATGKISESESIENNIQLKLFPNPVKNLLTVQWPGTASGLYIHDQSGRKVLGRILAADQHSAEINLAGWQNGFYLLSIQCSDGRHVIKFSKQ